MSSLEVQNGCHYRRKSNKNWLALISVQRNFSDFQAILFLPDLIPELTSETLILDQCNTRCGYQGSTHISSGLLVSLLDSCEKIHKNNKLLNSKFPYFVSKLCLYTDRKFEITKTLRTLYGTNLQILPATDHISPDN